MARVKTLFGAALSLSLIVLLLPSSNAAVPTLSQFPNIKFEFGSAPSLSITPPQSDSSGNWSYTSSNTGVVVVNGSSLVPVGVGTATITANQAASGGYSAASISATIQITPGVPKIGAFDDISVVYTAPASPGKYSKLRLNTPYSNSTGTWSFASLNPAVATVNGNEVSIISIGEAPIVATQAATSNFLASTPVTLKLSVTGPAPTLGVWNPIKITLKDSPYVITPPSSPSDGAWSYQIPKTDVVSLNGSILTINRTGSVIVTATQAKSKNSLFGPATATVKITISKNIPTVGAFQPLLAYLGEPSVEVVNPSSDSDGSWSYTISDQKIARIRNGVIVPVAEGLVTVTASQAATDKFEASAPVETTLVIGAPLAAPTAGNFENLITYVQPKPLKISPPQSTSKGQWSYRSSNPSILSSDGTNLIPLTQGLVMVTASQSRTSTLARIERTFQVKIGEPFTIEVTGGKNVAIIKSSVPPSRVLIDGQIGKTGTNRLVAGAHQVKVYINGLLASSSRVNVSGLKKLK